MFFKEYWVGLDWVNSDPWEAARWFRHKNRNLSAFGTFQIKTNKKIPAATKTQDANFPGFDGRQGIISLLLQASWIVEILQLLLLSLWWNLFFFCFYLHPTQPYTYFFFLSEVPLCRQTFSGLLLLSCRWSMLSVLCSYFLLGFLFCLAEYAWMFLQSRLFCDPRNSCVRIIG